MVDAVISCSSKIRILIKNQISSDFISLDLCLLGRNFNICPSAVKKGKPGFGIKMMKRLLYTEKSYVCFLWLCIIRTNYVVAIKMKQTFSPEHQTRENGKSFKGLGSIRPSFGLTISEKMKVHIVFEFFTDNIKAKHYCSRKVV